MTVTMRQRFERNISDIIDEPHSGARIALRANLGIMFMQEWIAGRLFTDEDVATMVKDARKEARMEALGPQLGRKPMGH